jgi:hypothetical protein
MAMNFANPGLPMMAILREWEALETEHQRLGDWRTQLEEHTKAASHQFASERSEFEREREDYKGGPPEGV